MRTICLAIIPLLMGLLSGGCDTAMLESVAAASGGGNSGSSYGSGNRSDNYDRNNSGYRSDGNDRNSRGQDFSRNQDHVAYGVRQDARELDVATHRLKQGVEQFLRGLGRKPTGGFVALDSAAADLENSGDRFSDLFRGNTDPPKGLASERLREVELAADRTGDRINALSSTPDQVKAQFREVTRIISHLDRALH